MRIKNLLWLANSALVLIFGVDGFVVRQREWQSSSRERLNGFDCTSRLSSSRRFLSSSLPTTALEKETTEASTASSSYVEQALRWRADAERIRLEAEKMDILLTLQKIQSLEAKLANTKWIQRQKTDEQQEALERQLQTLQLKLQNQQPSSSPEKSTSDLSSTSPRAASTSSTVSKPSKLPTQEQQQRQQKQQQQHYVNSNPLNGFDPEDLELYLPVARDIEARSSNISVEEQLRTFQSTPELQEHFQTKIRELVLQPMEDLQRLQELQNSYLSTFSDLERQQLKREMNQVEKSIEQSEGGILLEYTDSIFINKDQLPPLSQQELEQRLEAVGELPVLLQELYKRRCGVVYNLTEIDGDNVTNVNNGLILAIQLEHYEQQLELLLQVHSIAPLTEHQRQEARQAISSLPPLVRRHFAIHELGLEGYDEKVDDPQEYKEILRSLEQGGASDNDSYDGGDDDDDDDELLWRSLKGMMMDTATSVMESTSSPEYKDIDFVDRSRYVDEFYPCVARLESHHPSPKLAQAFCASILDSKRVFMMSSKPERVVGGYYLRGENKMLENDESGNKLVEHIQSKLTEFPELNEKLEFFYIPDPSPLSDEQVEMGLGDQPLILLTTKKKYVFYDYANPLIKTALSALGFCSVALFSIGTAVLQQPTQDQINAAFINGNNVLSEMPWLLDNAVAVSASFLAIVLVHELAHRIVAWINKFDVGLPTIVPSIQMGTMGSITPLESPPPTLRSLFDFAIAGPLAGLLASITFLVVGLGMTASMMTMDNSLAHTAELPALPMFLLRSSTLGGDLIELALGRGTLMRELPSETVLPLHPFAVSGFVGILMNALALLPLGHTDGGRIALSMFGRRGTYVVTASTHVLLCLVGLFGFDQSGIILTYNLYTMIWQRELETPTRNEVEELDFGRAAFAIGTALLVAMVLTPMA